MKTTEAQFMRQLRKNRREQSLCAQCGSFSIHYLCEKCSKNREERNENRKQERLLQSLCVSCGRIPHIQESLCDTCLNIKRILHPNLPIRKLRAWEVKNHTLYTLMMNNQCKTTDLATYVGVNERSVLSWLFENAVPKKENAVKVATFFDLNIDELFPSYKLKK